MNIAVIGISHKQASVEMRDTVAFTQSKKMEVMNFLLSGACVEEVVILSTCNRSEIYFVASNLSDSMHQVITFYLQYFQVPHLEPYVFTKTNEEAIEYLLMVTSGLDSMILGEDQILGQVKEDHELAIKMGASKKFLNKIFRDAITFAKKMKTEHKISENPLSISSVAVKLLQDVCKNFSSAKMLIIGSGTIGQLCLKYLKDAGVKQLYMCNRTLCTLQEQVEEMDFVTVIPYEARYDYMEQLDVVICATSSPHVILKLEQMPKFTKETIFMDLAMPIDIDRRIGSLDYARLYDIDDCNNIKEQNLQTRLTLSKKMAHQLPENVKEIAQWIHKTKVDPIIASFQDMCLQSQMDTMDLIQKKMKLSSKEYHYLEKLVEGALNRVIREPIKQLKQLETEEEIKDYKKVIHQLFGF